MPMPMIIKSQAAAAAACNDDIDNDDNDNVEQVSKLTFRIEKQKFYSQFQEKCKDCHLWRNQ